MHDLNLLYATFPLLGFAWMVLREKTQEARRGS